MTASISITISDDMRNRLDQVAALRDQESDDLIRAALEDYLTREIDIINAIQRGSEDIKAGRTVAHDDAMDEIDAMLDAMSVRKTA
ncbi:CopG family ribbon-helix-helix protein [Thalassospira sp.]|uniref:CopG family ribbon-helix-helix protein n=1 Tax=Thalassospira sp. TaxID=1912094 RepID=UPI0027322E61|nr:ribbon-helix-helix protein, CopG family [Thalassospira sp.]MDP2698706.1 ribbon-helix-helix protein, CopG family [Thalassospira sp.]